MASGIATSGATAGQFSIVPLVAVVLASFSWRWGYVGIAIATAMLVPLVWLIPDGSPSSNKGRASKSNDSEAKSWRSDLSKRLFAVAFGAVDYATVAVTTSLVASHLGLRVVGFTMGILTAGHQIGAAIGASLGGYFYSMNSSYDLVWISSIILASMAGLLVFLLKQKPAPNQCAIGGALSTISARY